MKKIIFAFILLSSGIQSQMLDTNVFKYFPLSVGDRWTWYVDQYWNPGPGYEVMKIQSSQVISNHLYFHASIDYYYIYGGHNSGYDLYRIDSLTGNLYYYNTSNQYECLLDSLNAKKIDSAHCTCSGFWHICDTSSYHIFSRDLQAKDMGWGYFEGGGTITYALNFGRVYEVAGAHQAWTTWYLRGCLINGVLYGDTSVLLGIQNISSEVPESFSLYQNYPNPFNPNTKIKFSIPADGKRDPRLRGEAEVKLIIYDALGRAVATLVNERLQPGTYEADWDASNYPSGVYFYKLETSSFEETKKMVLIK